MISLDNLKMEEQAIQHKWYVVRVKGGQEKKISTYIEKEVNRLEWNDFVTQILVPTDKVYQIRKGKKVSKERNFFFQLYLSPLNGK